MHLFLTGGTGTIGRAVLRTAIAQGHTVTALARSATSAQMLSAAGAQPLNGNLKTPDQWMPQAAEADVFIHLASTFDAGMADSEPRLISNLADHTRARSTPLRVLYTGGCWLYGETRNAVADEDTPHRPIDAFKWAAEAIKNLAKLDHLSTAIVHPAMVYDTQGGVFNRMLTALSAGRPAPVWGSEHTRWPLVHADDLARAYLMLAQDHNAVGPFNIVAEQGVPVGDIAAHLSRLAGIKTPPAVLPRKWVLARHGTGAEGPMLDQQMRSTRMADLGWTAEHTDFAAHTFGF